MKASAIRMLCLIAVVAFTHLAMAKTPSRVYFQAKSDTQKYAVIFGGIAVDKRYQAQFRQWTLNLHEILVRDYGYPADHITLLLDRGGAEASKIGGPCRLETITEAMEQLQKKVQPGDQINIFFIGHGTSDDRDAKFVIQGPDITAVGFAKILESFSDQDIAVVNTTSSSHPFCAALSAPGRVIVCATRSAAERYDTVFARFLLEALEGHAADRDKNQRVSLFETFLYVREKVKTWYTDQGRLPSEHPTLDDNGDGRFSTDPDPTQDDGQLAQIAHIDTLAAFLPEAVDGGSAAKILPNLAARVHALERSVILLRHRKSEMSDRDYWQQLEILLIDLARTTRRLKLLRTALQEENP